MPYLFFVLIEKSFVRFACAFAVAYRDKHQVEDGNVHDEQEHHAKRIQHGVAVYQLIEYFVRRAVASHQEHIIIIQHHVGDIRRNGEPEQNGKRDENVFRFHTCHARKADVQRGKSRNAVRDGGNEVRPRKGRPCVVVLRCPERTQQPAEQPEDEYEVQSGFFHSALAKRRHRNGDKLNAAKEQRQGNSPVRRVVDRTDDDFCNFKRVD